MKTHGRRRNADRGFTLVELLVVIMIIAILAGLLFPAITAAMENAQSLECRNNLKEIAQAVLRYASENGGVIVPAYDEDADLYWANILVMRGYVKATNLVAKPNEDPLEKRSILLCPSTLPIEVTVADNLTPIDDKAQGWIGLGNATHKVACSYYWNGCTDTAVPCWRQFPSLKIPTNQTNKRQFLHYLTEIRQRTSFVMAMDGIFMDAQKLKKRGRIAARHRGEYGKRSRTNIVFYDGHAEEYQWAQDHTTDPLWATAQNIYMNSVANSLSGGSLIFRLDDQPAVSP
ncbi:MAG: type II secretion system protein [Phycisphaerae bacterium]